MSRLLNPDTVKNVLAPETSEVFLTLLEIEEQTLTEPIRVVNNTENIDHLGETFYAAGFNITLAGEGDEETESVKLKIDNVDQRLTEAVRQATGIPTVRLIVVRGSDRNVPLVNIKFTIDSANITELWLEADLVYDNAINRRWPRELKTTINFPAGIFN